ncbi:hypothetical protein OC842_005818 [Tilletia horrida]|uniref:Uncharacterized protein n=1 Tax=Tilletia horrida TaxID=155126 RepID=A0AAN6JIA1_9BASI|nr:hypothetical protein OC842_005818 [Tilletia horrida]
MSASAVSRAASSAGASSSAHRASNASPSVSTPLSTNSALSRAGLGGASSSPARSVAAMPSARTVLADATASAPQVIQSRAQGKGLTVWVHRPVKTAEDLLKLAHPFHLIKSAPAASTTGDPTATSSSDTSYGSSPMHASSSPPPPPTAIPSAPLHSVSSAPFVGASGNAAGSRSALQAQCDALSAEVSALRHDRKEREQEDAVLRGSLQAQIDHLIKERATSDGIRRQLAGDVVGLKARVQELDLQLRQALSDAAALRARNQPSGAQSSDVPARGDAAVGGSISSSTVPARPVSITQQADDMLLTVRQSRLPAGGTVAYEVHASALPASMDDPRSSDSASPVAAGVGLFYAPVFVSERTSEPCFDSQASIAGIEEEAALPWQPRPLGSPRWLGMNTSAEQYGRARQLARRLDAPDGFERDRLVMLELLRRYAPGAMVAPFLAFVNENCVDHYGDLTEIGDRLVRQDRRIAELTDRIYQLEATLLVERERSIAVSERLLFSKQALRRARRGADHHQPEDRPGGSAQRLESVQAECTRLEHELALQKDLTRVSFHRLYRLSMLVMERGKYQLDRGFVVPLLPEGAGLRATVVQGTAGRLLAAPNVSLGSERAYSECILGERPCAEERLNTDQVGPTPTFEACEWDIDDTDATYERLGECPSPPVHLGSLCHAAAIDKLYRELRQRSDQRRQNQPLFDPSVFNALGVDLGVGAAST